MQCAGLTNDLFGRTQNDWGAFKAVMCDLRYFPPSIVQRICDVVCGTEVVYAAPRFLWRKTKENGPSSILDTYEQAWLSMRATGSVVPIVLCTAYAMSETDMGYAATRQAEPAAGRLQRVFPTPPQKPAGLPFNGSIFASLLPAYASATRCPELIKATLVPVVFSGVFREAKEGQRGLRR